MVQMLEQIKKLEDKVKAIFKIIDDNDDKRQERVINTAKWRTKIEINLKFILKFMWIILGTLLTSIGGIIAKFIYDFMKG